jgi:PST family polysaccharide transporter
MSRAAGDALRPPPPSAGSSLAGAATRGVFWSAATGAASKVVAAGSTLVLARLLDREAFGVAAYALTFTSLLDVLRGLGIAQALIYFPREERRTQTAFWLLAANSLVLGVLALAVAPLFGVFFRDPRAVPVIRALCLYFPLLAVGQVLDTELRKDLRFGKRFVPELTRTIVKALVGISLAVLGAGYWSLVTAHLAGAAVWSMALLAIVPWRPRRIFDREESRRLFGYGKHMVAVAVLVAITLRADHLVIGRFLGAAALGVYTIAFSLPAFVFQASSGLSQVLFPAYAKLERDAERLRSAALRTLRLAAAVFLPACAGMAVVTGPLVTVAFGRQWSDAAVLLPWMSAWAALTALTQHFSEVYKALGQIRVLSWMQVATAALTVPGLVWVGVEGWGLVAIVAILIAVRAVRVVIDLFVMRELVDLRPLAAARGVAPAFLASATMTAAVIAASRMLPQWPASVVLLTLASIGAVVYVGALAVLDRDVFGEVRRLLRAAIGERALAESEVGAAPRLS